MRSLKPRMDDLAKSLSTPTDSHVVHLQTLRKFIGYIALGLPFMLALGENLRDWLLPQTGSVNRALIEGSISAYFHTGMREVFVGSLCAIGVFLICYKGYERRDNIAANIAGICALLIALFPTPERSREAADTGTLAPDSVTLFSSALAADPVFVGYVHFISATVFFVTLAIMSLFLFTKSDQITPTPEKQLRNKVYVACGYIIIICIAAIALDKLVLDGELSHQITCFVFWSEAIAVVVFGISWLTKAEVLLEDKSQGAASTS